MPRILSVATAVPPNKVDAAKAREIAAKVYKGHEHLERLLPIFERAGVETRYLIHPAESYAEARSFDERNADFVEKGTELAEQAVKECLARAKIGADKIDHIYFVTTTGLATPSIDALLAQRMGFRPDVRRSPLFGLGCAGGVAAIARANEYLRAFPKHRALVVSLELCSLVFSPQATSPTDVIGATIFGDGSAAVLLGGDEAATTGPKVLFTKSILFGDAQDLMGWDFTSDGMRLVLSVDIPEFVAQRVKPAVEKFVLELAMSLSRVNHFVLHPGGPRIMQTYRDTFGLSEESIQLSRDSMRRHGNLSSAAVLFVLGDLLASGRPKAGDKGLMVALGPGFAAEMVLLSW